MPETLSTEKARAVGALRATVVRHGSDMAAAQRRAEALAEGCDRQLVSPGDTPALLAGVGTAYLEIFEAVRDLDALAVPVGSGSWPATPTRSPRGRDTLAS